MVSLISFMLILMGNQVSWAQSTREMYAILVSESGDQINSTDKSLASTCTFRIISSTDSTDVINTLIALGVVYSELGEVDIVEGTPYHLRLTNDTLFGNNQRTSLLSDRGASIRSINKSKQILWVNKMNSINESFIKFAQVKLGIVDFPKETLNVEHSLGSYYTVYSDDRERRSSKGSLYQFSNYSERVETTSDFKQNTIGLFVDTTYNDDYNEQFQGYRGSVYNTCSDTLLFPSIDGRLYIIAQAQDSMGVWCDIQIPSYSDCSFSYHTVSLGPGNQWTFVAPLPSGSHPTKIRMRLNVGSKGQRSEVVSNSFSGSINLGQLIYPKAN